MIKDRIIKQVIYLGNASIFFLGYWHIFGHVWQDILNISIHSAANVLGTLMVPFVLVPASLVSSRWFLKLVKHYY